MHRGGAYQMNEGKLAVTVNKKCTGEKWHS
jgi:hypothetical protein